MSKPAIESSWNERDKTSARLLETYDLLLSDYMPPGFLINDDRQLMHTFAGAGKYLQQVDGRPTLDILELLCPELKLPFTAALQRAMEDRGPAVYTGIRCQSVSAAVDLKLTVRPFFETSNNETNLLVLLEPTEQPPRTERGEIEASANSADQMPGLEFESRHAKETPRATIEQLEAANEELQASNRELEASNEELRLVNEEMYTVNAEHQRKINELTELTDDMDNLLNSTDVQILFFDRELRIRKFTPAIARTFSLIPQDVGQPIDNLRFNIDNELVEHLRLVLSTEKPLERYVQDGASNWHLLRIQPYIARHRTDGVVLTLVNVSDLKKAEARLAELSMIVKQSNDAIIRTDRDGIVSTWNRGAQRLFGYQADQIIGCNVCVLEPSERKGECGELRERTNQGHIIEHFETARRRKDGHVIDISLSISPLRDTNGAIVGAAKIAHDITVRKRAQEEIRQAVSRRDQFLAMLSHELRNPLGAMLNASAVLEHASHELDEKMREVCDIIGRQGRQMARLLDDLLDVSRVTQGKIDLRTTVFDLRAIISEALEVVQPNIDSRELELSVVIPEEVLPIDADRSRMLQVVENLLRNAVKYSPPGERIWLSLEKIDDQVTLRIKDSGIGIHPEELESIFDLFVQSHDSIDRSDGGMGVGLTLVRAIIELHGGSVAARSKGSGYGSEFVVTLPLSKRAITELDSCHFDSRNRAVRVVLVEDLPDSRHVMKSLLELYGCEVMLADDGPSGLETITRERPDVALVDIGLPGIDGYEIARQLRRIGTHDELFLVALTGYGQTQDRDAAIEAGFDEHLVKPIKPHQLEAILSHPKVMDVESPN